MLNLREKGVQNRIRVSLYCDWGNQGIFYLKIKEIKKTPFILTARDKLWVLLN